MIQLATAEDVPGEARRAKRVRSLVRGGRAPLQAAGKPFASYGSNAFGYRTPIFHQRVTSAACKFAVQADFGITLSGSNVAAWRDLTGLTAGFAATGTAQPLYTAQGLNGRPIVTCNGTTHAMSVAFTRPQPGTKPTFVWSLLNLTAVSAVNGKPYTGSTSIVVFLATGTTLATSFYAGAIVAGPTPTANVWNRWQNLFNNATSDYIRIGATTNATPTNSGNLAEPTSFWIGGLSGAQFCRVAIAALAIFDGKPTTTELANLDADALAVYPSMHF